MSRNPNTEIEKCEKNIEALKKELRNTKLLIYYYEKKKQRYINEIEVVEDSLF